jgi:ankyrin repeat protein
MIRTQSLLGPIFAAISLVALLCGEAVAASGKDLYQAVMMQDLERVQSLLSEGADANYRENGRSLLGWAAQSGSASIVPALLKGGANPNMADAGAGYTPLMRAIEMQHVDVVRELLAAKSNPNVTSTNGKTCLILAVESRRLEIVQALIDAKVDLQAVSPDGNSPALTAAQDGSDASLQIIRTLGKAGANLNASNVVYTPLI